MILPRNTEPQANGALARVLRARHPNWNDQTLYTERTNVIQEGTGKQPDIVVAAPRRQPVILETEFDPAITVDQDATSRLGKHLLSTGEEIEGVLSVVLPESLKTADLEAIDGAEFRYAKHYLNSSGKSVRWPAGSNWLVGGVNDLADAVEYMSLWERQLARGTVVLEQVVRNAAGRLARHAEDDALAKIATDLHQEAGEQTERMASAICVSAFVFDAAIERQPGIPPVPLSGSIDKGRLLGTWNTILAINYWPVFSIARNILSELPVTAHSFTGNKFNDYRR